MEYAAAKVLLTIASAVTPRISYRNLFRLLLVLSGYDASWTRSRHPLSAVRAFCPAVETSNCYSWLLSFLLSSMQSRSRVVSKQIETRHEESRIRGRSFREFGLVPAFCANWHLKGWFWWRWLRCWVWLLIGWRSLEAGWATAHQGETGACPFVRLLAEQTGCSCVCGSPRICCSCWAQECRWLFSQLLCFGQTFEGECRWSGGQGVWCRLLNTLVIFLSVRMAEHSKACVPWCSRPLRRQFLWVILRAQRLDSTLWATVDRSCSATWFTFLKLSSACRRRSSPWPACLTSWAWTLHKRAHGFSLTYSSPFDVPACGMSGLRH